MSQRMQGSIISLLALALILISSVNGSSPTVKEGAVLAVDF
jgi:hypothetical protein